MIYLIYDHHLNLNEWFVLALIIGGFSVIYYLPKFFPIITMIYGLLVGPFLGLVFDHSLAVPPVDLYDVGDDSKYELFDLLSYMMYSPFGYLFIYFYEKFHLKGLMNVLYILFWTILSIALEWVCVEVGVFHYKNGYRLAYSIPVYLFILSEHLFVFQYFFRKLHQRS
ncbi:hypothetical protein NDK43_12830 [Neobacillus pocheonensis]|uniref:Rod shape-determining protein MreD n=1 Tax=Neobacillus pocheonensis TaxID=363869 RepID=A0ABT0W9V3_9BACI|nr:hypothetical protein [Neobacillus pocheonensis]